MYIQVLLQLIGRYRRIIWFGILVLVFSWPLVVGFYYGHDTITHLGRAAFYEQALVDGQFPPRWAAGANYGHGSPFFIFYYPLSGYIIAILHLLGPSFELSYRITALAFTFLGVAFTYLWLKKLFDRQTALFGAFFFLILPYRFLTLFIRGGIGEYMAFTLLPLYFLCVEKSRTKVSASSLIFGGASYALIMLSHNGIALIFTPLFVLYAFLRGRRAFLYVMSSLTTGLLLSAYFWIPAIFEDKYTSFHLYFGQMYKDHFPPLMSLIYSPIGFGPDVNKIGGLSPQLGIPVIAVGILGVFGLLKMKKLDKKSIAIWGLVYLFGIFISTSLSSFLWEQSRFLQKFQFPWRFVVIPSFASLLIFSYLVFASKKKLIIGGFLIITALYSFSLIKIEKFIKNDDEYYYNYPGSTYFHNEGTTIWSAGDPSSEAKAQIEFAQGKGFIANTRFRTDTHEFEVKTTDDSVLVDNTVYFPGWRAYVDNLEVPIQFQDPNYRGIITFPISPGEHKVRVVFEETKIRLIADLISLTTMGIFILLYCWKVIRRFIF